MRRLADDVQTNTRTVGLLHKADPGGKCGVLIRNQPTGSSDGTDIELNLCVAHTPLEARKASGPYVTADGLRT